MIYPGHAEWTEVFDLKADPYETRNLIDGDSDAETRKRLSEEFDRQVESTGYHEPAGADKPAPSGRVPKKKNKKK